MTGTLHEGEHKFLNTSHWILLRMRSVSDKSCRENQNKNLMFNNFFSKNRAVYEMIWKNMLETDNTIWHICFAWRITKATNTHSVHVILTAFPRQQWLHECTSMLRYKDISVLFLFCVFRLVVNCSQYLTGLLFSYITQCVKELRSYTSLRSLGDR